MTVFDLKILSPQGTLYNGQIEQILVPAFEGVMGILPRHVSIISVLKAGVVEISEIQHTKQTLHISGGYLKFEDNKCTILCQ